MKRSEFPRRISLVTLLFLLSTTHALAVAEFLVDGDDIAPGATYTVSTPLTADETYGGAIYAPLGATINNNSSISAYYNGIYGEGANTVNNNGSLLSDQQPWFTTGINVGADSTVTNNSTITSEFGNAVIVGDGSKVTNNGTIDAYWDGISGGSNVTVTNAASGKIFSDKEMNLFGTGISLGDYAKVTNDGSITSAFGSGIVVGGGDETTRTTVINNGTISAAYDGIETGDYATVENHGTITSDKFFDGGGDRTGINVGDYSSVVNDGILTSQFGTAISVGYNSTILNTSKGVVTVGYTDNGGIETSDGNEILTNDGKITIKNAYTGIQMYDGDDKIINNGTLLIEYADNNGFGLGRGSDTLTNNAGATIQVDYAGWMGIHFGSSSEGNDILNNSGTITVGFVDGHGIAMSQGDDKLFNNSTGKIVITNAQDSAIAMGQGDDLLENRGTIQIGYSSYGLYMGDGDNTFDNYGKVYVENTPDWNGIHGGDGIDKFYNRSGAEIHIGYTGYGGLGFAEGDDLLDNAGTITIKHAGAQGIGMSQGNNTVINAGTINIEFAEENGIKFSGFGYTNSLTNTGTLNITAMGDGIQFANGNDTMTSSGALNFVVGDDAIDGQDGDDTLNLEGTGNLEINDSIANFEYLNKRGTGTWTINADYVEAYYQTNVEEGTLAINGDLYSDEVYIWQGATLTGDLSIYSGGSPETVYNDGTIAPGNNGIGTIYIDSDYYSSSTANLAIEAGNGESDQLQVAGYAGPEESDGGKISVTPVGYVADGDDFTILTAGSGIGYDPAALQGMLNASSLSLDFLLELQNGDTELHLLTTRVPYSALGLGGNTALGNALIELAENGNETASEILGLIDSCATVGCMQDALGSFSPEQYPNLLDASMAGSNLYRSGVIGRMGNLHLTRGLTDTQYASNSLTPNGPTLARLPAFDRKAGGWSGWARILGMTGDQDSDNGVSGFEIDSAGLSLGFDNQVTDNLVLGVGFGTTNSDIDFDRGQQTDMDSYHGGLYGTYSTAAYYLDAGVFYASNDYDSDRQPLLGPKATSSTDGTEWGIYVGGGYNLVDDTDWYFIPTASVEWAQVDIDGFAEKGALLNMQVDDYDADSLVTTLGFRLGANLAVGNTKVEPELRLAWAHEFGDTDRTVKAQFVGSTSAFSIDGIEPEEDSALVGLGLNAYMTDNLTLYIDYDGEFRSDFDGHMLSGGIRYNF